MIQEEIIQIVSNKLKLIRIENEYTQEKMAEILGVSKKTLVQIEKGRNDASWTLVVATCALFRESDTLTSILGEDPLEVIETIAHERINMQPDKTFGGKIWWKEVAKSTSYRLQQNVISQHYRILDDENYRWFSSFSKEEAEQRLKELEHNK
ncbi:helix-turn-helix transcriptional regulator [Sutcliffiella halmapala]|uniref:helix-turn-helix transcriptional regulator n=1 Tax=Sutcliffiella halmapala TaxID=79882 RepID=UPI0009955084|nr:helix-turn-helix domain-containing protein [Sutcliffiella halmapala]